MKFSLIWTALLLLPACASSPVFTPPPSPFQIADAPVSVGGEPAVVLREKLENPAKPQIVEVTVLPGRGMDIYQIRANVPGRGIVDLLNSPPLQDAPKKMNGGPDDFNGNQTFFSGGAILLPYANRIRGTYVASENAIETQIDGHVQLLPANWRAKKPDAEPHAMHGLILNRDFSVNREVTLEQATLTGLLRSDNFGGHWPGKADIAVTAALKRNSFYLSVFVKNTGSAVLPLGIGWHPYFNFPSGDRAQGRLRIPGRARLVMNNYEDVFPTGKLEETAGTKYDFDLLKGRKLAGLYLDDCFTSLDRDSEDRAVAELIDPAARFALRLKALSPEIKAFQVYAPVDQSFAAIEPQYNLGDPFSAIWNRSHVDTGIVRLPPGETAKYAVELELFTPSRY